MNNSSQKPQEKTNDNNQECLSGLANSEELKEWEKILFPPIDVVEKELQSILDRPSDLDNNSKPCNDNTATSSPIPDSKKSLFLSIDVVEKELQSMLAKPSDSDLRSNIFGIIITLITAFSIGTAYYFAPQLLNWAGFSTAAATLSAASLWWIIMPACIVVVSTAYVTIHYFSKCMEYKNPPRKVELQSSLKTPSIMPQEPLRQSDFARFLDSTTVSANNTKLDRDESMPLQVTQ